MRMRSATGNLQKKKKKNGRKENLYNTKSDLCSLYPKILIIDKARIYDDDIWKSQCLLREYGRGRTDVFIFFLLPSHCVYYIVTIGALDLRVQKARDRLI